MVILIMNLYLAAGQRNWGLAFGVNVLIHYLISYDRLIWMLKR